MAWKLTKKQTRAATRKFAEEIASMEACPHDRPIAQRIINHLNSALLEGQFRSPSWAVAKCKETGKMYRVNGKHSSTVLALVNGHFPKGLSVDWEEYECDTSEDVAKLYSSFDRRESARLTGDINRAYAAAHPNLIDLPSAVINLAVSGISSSLWQDYYAIKPEVRAAKLLEHPDFVVWLDKILTPNKDGAKRLRHLKRAPVVAAMFATYCKAKAASTEFWRLVKDGAGQDHKSADRKLNAYLLENALAGGGHRSGRIAGVNQREMYVKCLHAWNAWRSGGSTDLKYYPNADVPPVK